MLTEEKKNNVDKNMLKKYILRIILPIALYLIESGIIFIIKIDNAVAISIPIVIITTAILGVIAYTIYANKSFVFIDIAHKAFTLIVLLLPPILAVLHTFVL